MSLNEMNIVSGKLSDDKPRVDLSNIEEVILPNGQRFIKYVNPKDNSTMMLRYDNTNLSFIELFESIQMMSSSYQTQDASFNAEGIFQSQQRNVMQPVLLITFDQLEKSERRLNTLNFEQRKALNYFIQYRKSFEEVYGIKIKYLYPEECFAVDEKGMVISCNYVPGKDQPDIRVANVVKSVEDEKNMIGNVCGYFDDAYFASAIEYIEQFNQPMEVDGVIIDTNTLEEIRNNPDIVDSMQPSRKRSVMERLAIILKNKKVDPPKVKVHIKMDEKNQKNAAFVSKIMMASLAGFTVGIFVAILIFYIIKLIFK